MNLPTSLAATAPGVLVTSPSTRWREHVIRKIPSSRYAVQEAAGGAEALSKLESGSWQLLLLDRRLPDLDAEELRHIIRARFPGTEVLLLDSEDQAFPGPTEGDRFASWFSPGAQGTSESGSRAQEPCGKERSEPLPGLVGDTPVMHALYSLVRRVAPRTTTVMLTGATGTGKELVARAIHQLSPRAARNFVAVNCAAIPEALLESELFGHVRGAFTGAVQSHNGRIHAAHGGTLFLDEVAELPLALQAKLLRFLELKEVQRLGSPDVFRVDVRIVAATNAELSQRVAERRFRDDLYYRLAAFPIRIPSLAERVPDIAPLARHFLAAQAAIEARPCPRLSPEALRLLEAHRWAGNVRELQHVLERATILCDEAGVIRPQDLCFLPVLPAGNQEGH
jgi:DNA-binding NtrC family response regulator